ncbi:MAG: M3 family metallopeptidase [Patescibacteria group bacterium]
MSKKLPTASKLSYTPDTPLPKLRVIKEDWDLKKHFYKNEKVVEIEQDIQTAEAAIDKFAKKYQNGNWTSNLGTIVTATKEYLDLLLLKGDRPLYYLHYRKELDAADHKAEKMMNQLESRLTKISNQLVFFELQLARISLTQQTALLADKKAALYRHFFTNVFSSAKYQLSEAEEKILNLKSITSRGMWVSGTEKILNKKSISWKGKELPINGALMQCETLPWKERHEMWKKIIPVLEGMGEIAENELVALAHDKKIGDDLRGYKKPYSKTTKGYDSTDETLETLVSVIDTRGYALSKKYFALKKKILGKELAYIDRNEPVAKTPEVDFTTAVTIVRDVFYGFNKEYGKIFDEMLQNGQLDVWPKAGKGGGAFCSSSIGQPTLVFLNHNNSIDSLRTLAHEMGHAIHAYRSKQQPAVYEGHSILTAETASTFFESLVAEHLLSKSTGKARLALLDSFIGDKIGTMIMCIARFKFELEMHETIRREGGMSFKDMSAGLAKQFSKYCGPAITMKDSDGLSVAWKTHYRLNFYQYSYSFGEIGSSIMRSRYKKDSAYAKEVEKFLSLGESMSVEDIFKQIGIDMSKASTFNEGLDLLEEDIAQYTKLARELGMLR